MGLGSLVSSDPELTLEYRHTPYALIMALTACILFTWIQSLY